MYSEEYLSKMQFDDKSDGRRKNEYDNQVKYGQLAAKFTFIRTSSILWICTYIYCMRACTTVL